jgi:hypothetical protein
MKKKLEKILLGTLFVAIIFPLTSHGQSSSAPAVSIIEYAGFEDYYIELNVNGFNESEQTYKGIVKLIEHVDIARFDTLAMDKSVVSRIDENGNEEFVFKTNQNFNVPYASFDVVASDNEYIYSLSVGNKELLNHSRSLYLSLDFNGNRIEFFDNRDFSDGIDPASSNDGKDIEIVKILFNNELIFHRENAVVHIEDRILLEEALSEFKTQALKSGFDFESNQEKGRSSVRFYLDF